jgi:hypothetical protein
MRIRVKDVDVNQVKVRAAFDNAKCLAVLEAKMLAIQAAATAIFLAQVKHVDGVTPPPYASSFKIERIRDVIGPALRLSNTDPAAFWVEFGAYLPQNRPFEKYQNHPQILKYAPLRRGIDTIATGAVEGI